MLAVFTIGEVRAILSCEELNNSPQIEGAADGRLLTRYAANSRSNGAARRVWRPRMEIERVWRPRMESERVGHTQKGNNGPRRPYIVAAMQQLFPLNGFVCDFAQFTDGIVGR